MSGRPLRVGLVCPYSFDHPGGVQNHVLGLAQHLRAQGHEPFVLGLGRPEMPPALAGRFTSAGSAVPVRYNGSVARVRFGPGSAARARRWLADGGFDLLHVHEPLTPSISILALWAAEVPVVATFHTATPRSRSMQLAGSTLRGTVDKIDAGVAVSEPAARVVRRYLGRDPQVIPNGFSYAEFGGGHHPAGGWRGGERPRLVFLGRVEEPRKGLGVLMAALPAVRAVHPDLEVVVAGRGHRALPGWVRRETSVSDVQKAALLAGADVFVAPHTARESFGIVLLEALASGAPVVASDLPAFTSLLAHDRDDRTAVGTLFPTGDADALAAAVLQVLASRDAVGAERGRRHARRFDWSVVGPAVEDVYAAVLRPTADADAPLTVPRRSAS
ncbi:Phosphatidylinositol alpha-mannosyltransferase [Friedmanniella luteola]|uniref:Phosphatidylinositol alpha-mannosyltransferase n=1 Tax=Friedmanniella luteola TaxID=546871 RepID=A0A1H1TPS7_9ACTN|nr:glycosyltransferase family 4 protein [Friedmanniella luteola]SDS62227.1 Phosphatidylinositol alpha-mannosyltransferase [Friedmanniella luteola]